EMIPFITLFQKANDRLRYVTDSELEYAPEWTPLDDEEIINPVLSDSNPTEGLFFYLPAEWRFAILSDHGTRSEHLPRRATITRVRVRKNRIVAVTFEHD